MNRISFFKLGVPVLTLTLLAFSAPPSDPGVEHAEESLGDMEIAHIAYTAGLIDIRYAHLALAISDDENVREFARTMIRDHSAVNDKALALLQELGATPVDNPTSRKLNDDAANIRKQLMALEGKAFDKRYAANELSYHRFVNSTVEDQFIPGVQNDRFRDLLRSALKTFKVHEKHAERLAGDLNAREM